MTRGAGAAVTARPLAHKGNERRIRRERQGRGGTGRRGRIGTVASPNAGQGLLGEKGAKKRRAGGRVVCPWWVGGPGLRRGAGLPDLVEVDGHGAVAHLGRLVIGAARSRESHLGAAGAHGDAERGADGAVGGRAGVAHHQALALQHDGLRVVLGGHSRGAPGQQQEQKGQPSPQTGVAARRCRQRPLPPPWPDPQQPGHLTAGPGRRGRRGFVGRPAEVDLTGRLCRRRGRSLFGASSWAASQRGGGRRGAAGTTCRSKEATVRKVVEQSRRPSHPPVPGRLLEARRGGVTQTRK